MKTNEPPQEQAAQPGGLPAASGYVTLTADRDIPETTKQALGSMIRLASEALARGDFDDCPQCGKSCDMHAVWCPLYNEDADDD